MSEAETPTSGRLEFALEANTRPVADERRVQVLAAPGFGNHFTDHMVRVTWTPERGWHDGRVLPYGPIPMDPATAVLHYAQEIFEGLKAYRHADGSVWTFRPEQNAARFRRSARRMALPELPEEVFLDSIEHLLRTDCAWVPSGGESSLYLRPFMFASEAFLGVRPAAHVTYLLIASPAGAYFSSGVKPVSIWLTEDYTSAATGGTGAAKTGGNYAAGLAAQQEAAAHGCEQVCFLDAAEHRWVEELGGMNLYFVLDDGTIVTPELTGTILEGVTRDSVLAIAGDLGLKADERRIDITEWREGVASGRIREVFACGTAAVVTPVGKLRSRDGDVVIGDGGTGEVTTQVRETLLGIQLGTVPDQRRWMRRVC